MRIALLTALLLGVLAAPAAAGLRLVDDGPAVGAARTDGRYVVTGTGGATAIDTTTGRTRTLPTPDGCFAFAGVGHGLVVWQCPDHTGRLTDLRTGAESALPGLDATNEQSVEYDSVGLRWARVLHSGLHYAYYSYVDRATGATRSEPTARDIRADMDAAALTRPLCDPVVRPVRLNDAAELVASELGPMRDGYAPITTTVEPSPGMFATRVVLQRCGHRRQVLDRCTGSCSDPALVRGRVAWVSAPAGGRPPMLVIRALRSGRTTRVRVAPDARMVGAAGDRVYLVQRGRLKHVIV